MTYIIIQTAGGTALLCGRCGRLSYNKHDISERYCGGCHTSHEEEPRNRLDQMRANIIGGFVGDFTQQYAVLRGRMVDRQQAILELSFWLPEIGYPMRTLFAQAAIITAEWLIEQRRSL